MRVKKLLSSILAIAMVLSTMCFSVSAESENVLGEADFETNGGVVFDGTDYYDSLADAVKAVHAIDDAILYCKPGADLGAMTHGHVCKNLTVFGNSAYLSGGEQDFEIDFPAASGTNCSGLTGDVTLTVDNLKGAGAWGSRTSEYDVNLIFTNCKNMGKVFYMGTTGEINITMTDCTFTSNDVSNCKVYSNAAGTITLTNVDFSGIEQPVALGNDSTGTQTIILTDCDFENCGASTQDWTVPVSVKSKKADGSSVLKVENCTFTGTVTNSIGQDADILFDYGVGKISATILNTTAKVGVETEANNADYAEINVDDSVIMTNESAATLTPVAEINGTYYASVQAAVDAAQEGTTEIQLLPGTIDENVFILQQADKNIIIKGSDDVVYTGTFEICGNNRAYTLNGGTGAKETLTFEGINFKGEDYTVAHDFIGSTRKNTLPTGTLVWAYPHNVTVKNCTFTGNYIGQSAEEYAGQEVVAMRNVGGYNWTIENCTGINLHSMYQASANTLSSKIDNITVADCQSGLNLGTQANYTITNSIISVTEFAIRADLNGNAADLVIDNCKLSADETIVLRRDATTAHNLVITNSSVVSNLENPVHITRSKHTVNSNIALDIDLNYWGGVAPSIEALSDVKPEALPYYEDEEMTQIGGVAAKIGEQYFTTIADAIAKASDGDVVYVLPGTYDFGTVNKLKINKSITITGNPNYGASTFATRAAIEKPVIKISDVTNGGVEYHAPNVTFDNLVFEVVEDATGSTWNIAAIGYYYENTANREGLTVTNCDFINNSNISLGAIAANIGKYTITNNTFTNFATGVWSYVDHGAADEIVVSDNTFANVADLVNIYHGASADGTANVTIANNRATDDSTTQITVIDFGQQKATPATAYDNVTIIGNDAEVVLGNYAEDSFNDTIEGNDAVVYTYASEAVLRALESAGVPDGDVYVSYGSDKEVMYKVVDGKVYAAADALEVEFELASEAEGEKVYNINLKANAQGIINRLNSADLAFLFSQVEGNNEYEIIASNDEVAINPVDNSKVRYEFHYNGKTDVTTDTDTVITIGQVKFTGYGKFSFAVDASVDTNAAHSTTMQDNIVDTFVPNGDIAAGEGELDISDDTITDVEIAVPTRTLTINIDFPNAVVDQAIAYQDMKVEITGNIDGVNKTVTYDLGGNMVDGSYVVTEDKLVLNNAYTVTVSGAGYRTARYTVNLNDDKQLNFWNNVKDEAQVVEIGKDSSVAKVTFLAGDIVKDNNINIYDLSAVVSYFGTEDCVNSYPEYAKYDLNRDGVIDSKDVAYVLVSWNN